MRRLLLGLLAAVLVSTGSTTDAVGSTRTNPPDGDAARHVRLGGVDVVLRGGTTRVVTVNRTRGFHARVVLWALRDGAWVARLRAADGRIGYGGLVVGARRRQGTGTTPLGSYGLISAFGTHARRPAWDLGYRKIRRGDFWVQDNGSRFYNRYRNQRQGGFRWRLPASAENGSERLTDFPVQYEFSIVTSFNQGQVRHRGAGIFLHVNGTGATAGCVSAPRWFLAAAMARLDADLHPVIAVGR
ncbi:MAG: secreted protein [Nocardioides sp.]|nr:secreted protein [Nocardioides sp.]